MINAMIAISVINAGWYVKVLDEHDSKFYENKRAGLLSILGYKDDLEVNVEHFDNRLLKLKTELSDFVFYPNGELFRFKWHKASFENKPRKISIEDTKNCLRISRLLLPNSTKSFHWEQSTTLVPSIKEPEDKISVLYNLKHEIYPTYPITFSFYNFYTGTKKLIDCIGTQPHRAVISRKLNEIQAIEKARLIQKKLRADFPREKGIVPLVGPKSPRLVLHKSNWLADDDYNIVARKLRDQLQGEPVFVPVYMQLRYFPKKQITGDLHLCWLVNVAGDICCIDAGTGEARFFQYSEQGAYFRIDKSGNLDFSTL